MMVLGACLVAIPVIIGINDNIENKNRREYAAKVNAVKKNVNRDGLAEFGIYV